MGTTRVYDEFKPTFCDRSAWTLPHVLRERARTHGAKTYVKAPQEGVSWTYRETLERSEALARNLVAGGSSPGDRLVVMAPNCADYLIAWFGANLAGVVEVPINTAYEGTFLEHQVRVATPRLAVVAPEFAERFLTIDACESISQFYVLGDGPAAGEAIERLRGAGFRALPFAEALAPCAAELPAVGPHELANIFFTSGTTGPSKGVMMPFGQVYFFADECVSLTRLTDADTYMAVGPLFHGNAAFLAAYPALIAGATFVLYEKFSASQWSTWVRESGATVTNLVGVMMDFVWKQEPQARDANNKLRCVFAAPTAHSIVPDFKKRFGVDAIVELFGQTEISAPIMAPYGVERPPGACGLAVDEFFDVRLVDPATDEVVPVGSMGELVVRPRLPWTICSGYFNMPERSYPTTRNLWFHTGDGMRQDEDGWFYFVDRLKDTIRRRGENISSYEIEQVVLEMSAVRECAAVGIPADSEAGEDEVVLFAVVDDPSATTETIMSWCVERLPRFAIPRHVWLIDALPVTPSSKVLKSVLRVRALEMAAASVPNNA